MDYTLHFTVNLDDEHQNKLGRFAGFSTPPTGDSQPPSRAWSSAENFPSEMRPLPGNRGWVEDQAPDHSGVPKLKEGDRINVAVRFTPDLPFGEMSLTTVFARAMDGPDTQGASPFLADGYRICLTSSSGTWNAPWWWFRLGTVGRLNGLALKHFEFSVVLEYRYWKLPHTVQISHDPEVICDMSGS